MWVRAVGKDTNPKLNFRLYVWFWVNFQRYTQIPTAVLHRWSSDFCMCVYIYITFYTLQNLIFRKPDFLFVTIHFKVYTYILNYLCFWFLLFICHFFWRKKRGGGFFIRTNTSGCVLIFRLNFQSIFSLPKSCDFTFKEGRRKNKRIQQDLKLFFFWIVTSTKINSVFF